MHIQSEAHPVYLASRRVSVHQPRKIAWAKWGVMIFIALLMVVPVVAFTQSLVSSATSSVGYHDQILEFIMFTAGAILSLSWTIPIAALAGQGISHERVLQTWDTLRTTPYSTDVILLAKAAADIRFVWGNVVTTVLISIFMAFALIATTVMAISQSFLMGIILIAITVIMVAIERVQEVALSVVLGISASLVSSSSGSYRLSFLLGLLGGVVMRLIQLMIVIGLATLFAPSLLPQFSFLSTIVGTSVLVAIAPGLLSLSIIVCMIGLREILIQRLFGWAVQHTHEG
jgi:hypothetical protein